MPLEKLAGRVWATAREGTAYAHMVERLCRSAGFEPDVRHRVNDLRLLLDLVAEGQAVAIVPSLGRPGDDPRVTVRPIDGSGAHDLRGGAGRATASARRLPPSSARFDDLRLDRHLRR